MDTILSINEYKKMEYKSIEYPQTSEILTKISNLEIEITEDMSNLDKMLADKKN